MPLRFHFNEQRVRAIFYLIVVPALIVAILVVGITNWKIANNRALKQARINQGQIVRLKAADRRIRHALAEVCRTQTITFGILNAVVVYLGDQYPHPTPAVRVLTDTLTGYTRDLGQMTACSNITRP